MSEKYLTKDGLAYFLSKLDSRFAGKTHVHGNITNDGKLNGGANKVVVTDSNKFISVSSISTTELGYLSGVTSNIQTQLNSKASSSSLSNYLPLTGGTLSNNVSPILSLKRTSASAGAFIEYKNNNQDVKLWRVGVNNEDKFGFYYSTNSGSSSTALVQISTSGNIQLNNNIGLQWKNSSGTYVNVMYLDSSNNLIFSTPNGTAAINATFKPYDSTDATYDLGKYSSSTNKARWRNLYLSGTIRKDNASYGLSLPTMSSWTANKTIATEDYVNNAISSSITTVLNTPV